MTNLLEGTYIAKLNPILERIENAQNKLKKIKPNYNSLNYIKFGDKNYKSVPAVYSLLGVRFFYTTLKISNKLVRKYSKFKTMKEATVSYEQIEILEKYKSDLEETIKRLT